MKYTKTQLSAIKIFGKKDLSFGCIVKTNFGYKKFISNGVGNDICILMDEKILGTENFEILGHEPHLEDVFRVAKEKDWIVLMDESSISIRKWREKNTNDVIPCIPYKLLINQEDVLTQLINLFKNAT